MDFSALFKVFSRRPKPHSPTKALTQEFRNRVFMRCRDVFGACDHTEFWGEISSKLMYLHGTPVLSTAGRRGEVSGVNDAIYFLQHCSDEQFLDFVEFIFSSEAAFRVSEREKLVDDFNSFLRVDDLPYSVTPYVWTKGKSVQFGREYETTSLTGYPQVIRRDSELIHENAVAPTLALLADSRFAAASKELHEALKDYRHQDYGDCITKCVSGFESALKVICHENGWPFSDNDTASLLLKTVIANVNLEPFWEQPLMLVATLRNRVSTAHGAGTGTRDATEAKAEYAINATASAILFLIRTAT